MSPEERPAHTAPGRDRTPATVLIVDDQDEFRETTAAILSKRGFGVTQAGDGVEALDKLARDDFDVLLLDLRLPRMDGPAVLEALTEPPTVVILSAFEYFDEAALRERFGSLVFECLRKPVPPDRLVAVVLAASERAHGG